MSVLKGLRARWNDKHKGRAAGRAVRWWSYCVDHRLEMEMRRDRQGLAVYFHSQGRKQRLRPVSEQS